MDDKIGMEPVKAFEKIVEEINEMQIQTQMRKKLPVGIENFAEFSSENFYYVDKTMFIKEILLNWGKVNLFTRPRRFGKSLNMSMLNCLSILSLRLKTIGRIPVEMI